MLADNERRLRWEMAPYYIEGPRVDDSGGDTGVTGVTVVMTGWRDCKTHMSRC
jgi:hypothetical protein